MSSVGVLFVGAALLVNGLLLLGHVDPRSAGVFNLFVGGLQTAIPAYLLATAQTPDEILGAAGIFLFGFTYLYVGIGNLAGVPGTGLGWYSAWVALLAVGFAVVNVVRFDDPSTALLWAQWSVLWTMFFVVLGLGRERWTEVTGWLTLVLSFTTCTVPGFVMLLGLWGDVSPLVVLGSIVATAALLVVPLRRIPRPALVGEPVAVPAA
ncbi:AmiS/UreI family transporter [Nocardioides acrostichi]|uniref:Transporter n=1 Tax=Nocardioides acrostichi TaxID=2784339 RepID=A0A930Y8I7_9ACTN|nr:AmiS/UreI family transporter [Nocardioides acrostichi]MBF4163116.1 transporter [Nocardioides acrostichi]